MQVPLTWKTMIKSLLNFAHITTSKLSEHVQYFDPMGPSTSKLDPHHFSQDFDYKLISFWDGFPVLKWLEPNDSKINYFASSYSWIHAVYLIHFRSENYKPKAAGSFVIKLLTISQTSINTQSATAILNDIKIWL